MTIKESILDKLGLIYKRPFKDKIINQIKFIPEKIKNENPDNYNKIIQFINKLKNKYNFLNFYTDTEIINIFKNYNLKTIQSEGYKCFYCNENPRLVKGSLYKTYCKECSTDKQKCLIAQKNYNKISKKYKTRNKRAKITKHDTIHPEIIKHINENNLHPDTKYYLEFKDNQIRVKKSLLYIKSSHPELFNVINNHYEKMMKENNLIPYGTEKMKNNIAKKMYSYAFNYVPKCKIEDCYRETRYLGHEFKEYCSTECSTKSEERKQNNIKAQRSKEVNEKRSKSLKKSAPQMLKKLEKTMIEKYGVSNYSYSEEYKKRLPEILEKIKNTTLKNYRVFRYTQSDEFKERYKKHCLEKFGAPNYSQSDEYRKLIFKNSENLTPEYVKKYFIDKKTKYFKLSDFCNYYDCSTTTAIRFLKIHNINYNKKGGTSYAEREISSFIKELNFDVQDNTRSVIPPLELDIYIPEKNLAIEFNGLYWHSVGINNVEELSKYRNKHLQKTEACESKNINLLHIFENEWTDLRTQDIWKSIIKYKLNKIDKKYYARKLEIKEVPKKEAREFEQENHLQGSNFAKINLGLYHNDELISLMTFSKSRFNKKYEYELIRFCSKKYTACVGCAQKLFKHFIKKYNPRSIISYANRRWASRLSNVYKSLNFKELKPAEPNYFYFKLNQDSLMHVLKSRNVFQKHKLKDHPETKDFYDPSKSELYIMLNAGFRRIYDAGNLVYEWRA